MIPPLLNRLPPRCRRWLPRLFAVWMVYSFVGFLLLPVILKWQLIKQLPDLTKRQAAVRQVRVNPWALSLTVRGLALTEPEGRPFASWDELYVNFQASSLFRLAWTFKEIRLAKPVGEIILLKNGQLNLANMFEAPTNAPPPAEPGHVPRVIIGHLQITNGFVAFEDRTRRSAFRVEYRPINLSLDGFTTRPGADTPYAFHAESDAGRSITWAGDLSVQPLKSAGRLALTGVRIPRYQPYFEDFTRAVLTNGLAEIAVEYRFQADTNGVDLVVSNGVVQVAEFQCLDPETSETVAAVKGLEVRGAGLDYRQRDARLGTVEFSEVAVLARINPDRRVNLLELLAPLAPSTNAAPAASAKPAAMGPPWNMTLDDLAVRKTAVTFEDLSLRTPFKTRFEPIEISLKGLSTRPNIQARYSFRMATESSETVSGEGLVSINPVWSVGTIKLAEADLKKYVPYVEGFFRGKVLAGKLQAQAPYRFALETSRLRAGVSNAAVKLSGLEVKPAEGDETVAQVREFALDRVEASLEDQQARLGRAHLAGGAILVRRQKDGSINLTGLVTTWSTNLPATGLLTNRPATSTASASSPAWKLKVDEIAVEDYALTLEDLQPANPAKFVMDQMALTLKDVSTDTRQQVGVRASLRVNQTGAITATGTTVIAPLKADFTVGVTNLDLRVLQPYLDEYARLVLSSALLHTGGRVVYQEGDSSAPRVSFTGGVRLTNFVAADQVQFKEFARWSDLAVTGIAVELSPNKFEIEEIRWVAPKASVVLGPDRKPNLSLILKEGAAASGQTNASAKPAESATATTNTPALAFPVKLGVLRLEKASLAFTDESIQPKATVGIQELSGTIKGLSSALNTAAEVDLAGRVDAQSPFAISGRVNPLASDLFVDLVFTNANTQLTPLTPYLEKYAGHPLNKGRLNTRLHYRLQGQQLLAENKVQIDQLTLGPRNNSPDATKLPVKLGVALLKDSNGRIELDVPVGGSLDDPSFKVGPVVLKVVVNLLARAATSPFKLLGALVGGGEEMSFVEFDPGVTNVAASEVDKLVKLAKALEQRPALNLEIEGAVDPALDRDALAREKLEQRLRAERIKELTARGQAPSAVESFQIETAERERLLRAAFVAEFGTNIAAILQTNQVLLGATNPPTASAPSAAKEKRNLWQRFTVVFHRGPATGLPRSATKGLSKEDRMALGQATPELMEILLSERIQVGPEDFARLMEARARWVQDWMVQAGRVAPDRLFLIAPRTVDGAYRGQNRASLSLN